MVAEITGYLSRQVPKRYRWLLVAGGLLMLGLALGPDVAAIVAAPAEIEATNARIDALVPKVDDTHCYVKAMAGVDGFTVDGCALK